MLLAGNSNVKCALRKGVLVKTWGWTAFFSGGWGELLYDFRMGLEVISPA